LISQTTALLATGRADLGLEADDRAGLAWRRPRWPPTT